MAKQNLTKEGAFVLAPVVQRYTFAKPFKGNDAREVYEAVKGRVAKDFKDIPAFTRYFEFNDSTGQINGSTLFHGILIDEELRKAGLWLPTIVEARQIDKKGELTNEVYRDCGLAVYNSDEPNAQIAKGLVKEATKREWKTPILAPFKALNLKRDRNKYGIIVGFRKDVQDVMHGEEAEDYIRNQIDYKGNSGAHRLYRNYGGDWGADWGALARSGADGRVDWVCGEATAQNLEKEVLDEFDRVAQMEIQRINEKLLRAKEAGLRILTG